MTRTSLARIGRDVLVRHAAAALDWLWPPICSRCGGRAEQPREQFCRACWSTLRPLRSVDAVWTLGAHHDDAVPRAAARAAFAVDGLLIEVLTTAKYRGVRPVGLRLADLAARHLVLPPGVLVPVPLTAAKRRERGFNQSADFARALARTHDRSLRPDLLVRLRGGRALAGLPHDRRREAVRGAFAVPERVALPARPVIVVDDVITTGSTARECVAALGRAGVREIHVAAMARAFQAGDDGAPVNRAVLEQL